MWIINKMMMSSLLLASLASIIMGSANAENAEKTAYEARLKSLVESRKGRLAKIHEKLFTEQVNLFHLGVDIKELIHIYKNHLQKFETAKKFASMDNLLLKDIELLLTRLEKGSENPINDQAQAKHCYELVSAIESLFEKLENPTDDFDSSALPLESSAIVESYKRLKGEQLPCHVTSNKLKKKRKEETEELSPLSPAQIKISTLMPAASEEDGERQSAFYD
ncbi:hypothetical protein [Candidatus Paracaedibacter symbiosus]|uniref:hypothetical protein n=1 Tax=Candidatus Paracaedibacter symbiosus TaxID=244582 RepID=UPI000509B631|nr:hypothetical protein [Candidatus Paracaedibacter symbiosus]